MKHIKAILLDSGKVLNGPASGHWFITPNFWQYVNGEKFKKDDKPKLGQAFQKANEYINMQKLIITKEEEYQHFVRFYQIFAENVPELRIEQEQIEEIAKDLVYNPDKYVFYEDALQMIPKLSKEYQLAVVSDAWPSLRDVFVKQGMDQYFECFVISSMIGTCKPDVKMYETALDKLGINPEEAVFVDDNLSNCIGAKKLGIHSFLLCRDKRLYLWNRIKSIGKGCKVITSLNELAKYL